MTEPGALDAAFQAMIVWCDRFRGAPSLPVGWAEYRQFGTWPAGAVTIACRVTPTAGSVIKADMEFTHGGRTVAQIRGYECVVEPRLTELFAAAREARA
jgi:hypothetical protein